MHLYGTIQRGHCCFFLSHGGLSCREIFCLGFLGHFFVWLYLIADSEEMTGNEVREGWGGWHVAKVVGRRWPKGVGNLKIWSWFWFFNRVVCKQRGDRGPLFIFVPGFFPEQVNVRDTADCIFFKVYALKPQSWQNNPIQYFCDKGAICYIFSPNMSMRTSWALQWQLGFYCEKLVTPETRTDWHLDRCVGNLLSETN